MLAAIVTFAPMNLKATTGDFDDGSDDDNDSPTLTMTKKSSNPSGEKVREMRTNDNSQNAAVKIERSMDHEVRGEPSDEPAHTSTRTVERGDTVTEITRESAPQSSASGQHNTQVSAQDDGQVQT